MELEGFQIDETVDITDKVCPLTFVKAKVVLDEMDDGQILSIRMNDGEPVQKTFHFRAINAEDFGGRQLVGIGTHEPRQIELAKTVSRFGEVVKRVQNNSAVENFSFGAGERRDNFAFGRDGTEIQRGAKRNFAKPPERLDYGL